MLDSSACCLGRPIDGKTHLSDLDELVLESSNAVVALRGLDSEEFASPDKLHEVIAPVLANSEGQAGKLLQSRFEERFVQVERCIEELRIAFERKFKELEARSEAVDGFVRQQFQECSHSTENLGLMWQHFTTSSQRVEAVTAQRCKAIEARFDAEMEALRACMGSHVFTQVDECCKSQERLNKFLGGVESGNSVRSEHDLSERLRLVSEKIDGMPAISPQDVELCNNEKPDVRALFADLGAAASNGVNKRLHDCESLGEATANVLPTNLRQHQSKNFLAQGECQEIHDAAECNIFV